MNLKEVFLGYLGIGLVRTSTTKFEKHKRKMNFALFGKISSWSTAPALNIISDDS